MNTVTLIIILSLLALIFIQNIRINKLERRLNNFETNQIKPIKETINKLDKAVSKSCNDVTNIMSNYQANMDASLNRITKALKEMMGNENNK